MIIETASYILHWMHMVESDCNVLKFSSNTLPDALYIIICYMYNIALIPLLYQNHTSIGFPLIINSTYS